MIDANHVLVNARQNTHRRRAEPYVPAWMAEAEWAAKYRMLVEALPAYEQEIAGMELRLASLRLIRNSIRTAIQTEYAPSEER